MLTIIAGKLFYFLNTLNEKIFKVLNHIITTLFKKGMKYVSGCLINTVYNYFNEHQKLIIDAFITLYFYFKYFHIFSYTYSAVYLY